MGDGAVLIQAVLVALAVMSVLQVASLRRARRRHRRLPPHPVETSMPRHPVVPAEWRRRVDAIDDAVVDAEPFEWDGGESVGIEAFLVPDGGVSPQ